MTVENGAPPAPTGLAASPSQQGGWVFAASWNSPPGQLAPITGATHQQLCPAAGGPCAAAGTSATPGHALVGTPGPGSWILAVWLTNAAGNSDPANAPRIALIVPNPARGGHPRLYVTEVLRGRKLIVSVSGPASDAVHVSFTARHRGRRIERGARTVSLRSGRATPGFKLSRTAVARAVIIVTAQLDHQSAVTSTLRRSRQR